MVDDLEGLTEVEQITRLVDDYYAFVSHNIYSVKFILSLLLREEKHPDDVVGHMNELQLVYRNLIADILDAGRRKGVFRPTIQPTLDAGLLMSALYGILVQGFMGTGAESAEQAQALLRHLKSALLDSLLR